MPLIYAAVVRNKDILVQYAAAPGNMDITMIDLLSHVKESETRTMIERNSIVYYILKESSGLFFVVAGDAASKNADPFSTIDSIKRMFLLNHAKQWENAVPFAFQSTFTDQLRRYVSPQILEKTEQIKQNLVETQSYMVENMASVVTRGEMLENMEKKANDIASVSEEYSRDAKSLRMKMCYEKYRVYIVYVCVLIVVFAIIYAVLD